MFNFILIGYNLHPLVYMYIPSSLPFRQYAPFTNFIRYHFSTTFPSPMFLCPLPPIAMVNWWSEGWGSKGGVYIYVHIWPVWINHCSPYLWSKPFEGTLAWLICVVYVPVEMRQKEPECAKRVSYGSTSSVILQNWKVSLCRRVHICEWLYSMYNTREMLTPSLMPPIPLW